MRLFLAAAFLVLTPAALAAPTAAAGKAPYVAACAGCHGANAKGGVGPSLKQSAAWKPAQFKLAITQGKAPKKTLAPMMPRFPKSLPGGKGSLDDQVKSVQLYIKSLKP